MARRKAVRGPLGDSIAIYSRRRCCLCFAHHGDFGEKAGQIAHIDRDNRNRSPENLAYLCLDHHNRYDSGPSQAKGLTPGELRACKDALEEEVRRRLPRVAAPEIPAVAARPSKTGDGPSDRKVEEYRRALLDGGVGFLIPPGSASAILRALSGSADATVKGMADHGHFTDDSGQELLVLPPSPQLLKLVSVALGEVALSEGTAVDAADALRAEIDECVRLQAGTRKRGT